MTPQEAREAVASVLMHWSNDDTCRLAAIIALGPPSKLHSEPQMLTAEREAEHGGSAMRAVTTEDVRFCADVLHAYRIAARRAGVPLPPPGAVE